MKTFITRSENLHSANGLKKLISWIKSGFTAAKPEKQFLVHPCQINGKPTLVYEKGLPSSDPEAFQYLCTYADRNGFEVLEDRRDDFVEGVKRVKDKNSANVMTIIVLAGCLLSPKAFSKTLEGFDDTTTNNFSTNITQVDIDDDNLDRDLLYGRKTSENDLMHELLDWINENSSYDYGLDDMPKIEKVNEVEMLSHAFGGKLPAAVTAETSKIKGLYNYHNKLIYILDSFDINNLNDRSILLHEIVHFLQFQHGDDKFFECKKKLESFAYRLQAKFLHDHKQQIDFDGAHIRKASECK